MTLRDCNRTHDVTPEVRIATHKLRLATWKEMLVDQKDKCEKKPVPFFQPRDPCEVMVRYNLRWLLNALTASVTYACRPDLHCSSSCEYKPITSPLLKRLPKIMKKLGAQERDGCVIGTKARMVSYFSNTFFWIWLAKEQNFKQKTHYAAPLPSPHVECQPPSNNKKHPNLPWKTEASEKWKCCDQQGRLCKVNNAKVRV